MFHPIFLNFCGSGPQGGHSYGGTPPLHSGIEGVRRLLREVRLKRAAASDVGTRLRRESASSSALRAGEVSLRLPACCRLLSGGVCAIFKSEELCGGTFRTFVFGDGVYAPLSDTVPCEFFFFIYKVSA